MTKRTMASTVDIESRAKIMADGALVLRMANVRSMAAM
jgi:hypothetical protein